MSKFFFSGINFPNVEEAAKSVSELDQKNNVRVINKEKLRARLAIVKENLRAAARSKHLLIGNQQKIKNKIFKK